MDEMTHEDIIEPLAILRAVSAAPAQWRDVAMGRLPASVAAQQLRGIQPEEDIEASVRLFAPRPSDRHDRRIQELCDAYYGKTRAPRRWWIVGGVMALAATLLVALAGRPVEPLGAHYSAPQFRQQHETIRGIAPERSVAEYLDDQRIEIWLSPRRAIEPPLDVVVLGRHDGAPPTPLMLRPRVLDNGVVHVDVGVGESGLSPGHWELLFLVGRPGALPDDPAQIEFGPSSTEAEPFERVFGRIDVLHHERP